MGGCHPMMLLGDREVALPFGEWQETGAVMYIGRQVIVFVRVGGWHSS